MGRTPLKMLIVIFLSLNLIYRAQLVKDLIETICKFSIDYISPIQHLTSRHLAFEQFYVYKAPKNQNGLDMSRSRKQEQTLEEATAKLLVQLRKILE